MEKNLEHLSRYMSSEKDRGWSFGVGNPEFFHFRDRLLVENGTVLDLGIGWGRSSMFFAMHGMSVEGIDSSPEMVDDIVQTAHETGLQISARQADMAVVELEPLSYDVVLMDLSFVHFDSREKALATMQNGLKALKVGGHLWIRAVGKDDSLYASMDPQPPFYIEAQEDPDVRWQACGCSGVPMIEPHLFFGQTDLLQFAVSNNLEVVLNNSMPRKGQPNFMYGEDFVSGGHFRRDVGYVTLLAQKK